jgi:hypothetical protein
MNRRLFCRRFLGLLITTPTLVACARGEAPTALPPTSAPQPAPTTFPNATDETSVAGLLSYYAELLQLPVMYSSPELLIATLPTTEATVVRDVNDRMQRNDFTDFSRAVVYGTEEHYFYTVGFRDGLNACGAFFVRGLDTVAALLEGPAAVGFSNATRDFLRSGATISNTRSAFLPRNTEVEALGRFDRPYQNVGRYNTNAGSVEIDYDTNGRGNGQIALVSRNHEGGKLFEQIYDITYSI